ncbi:hypothetical protein N9O95_03690 [Alphaproteobacteria bacterium]|nr:hypothetical protein [Alphaproteobacteria bacterium]
MHLNSINVDYMSITELEALHQANTTRPPQVPLSALRTATQYFQAKDGVIRGDIVQSLCTSLSRAPETTLRDLEPLFVFGSENEPIIVDGHHRLEALHHFFQETEGDPKVNVQWIEGGYLDAQRSVISSNSIARTNLSPKQRTQQAWQQHVLLLKQGVLLRDWRSNARSNWRFTKEQAKEIFDVSLGSFNKMRSFINEIRGEFMDETSTNHFVVTHNGDFEAFIREDPLYLEKTKWQQVERKMMDFRSGNTFDPSDDFDVVAAADELEEQFRKSFGPEQLHSLSNGGTWGEALVRTRPYSALVAIRDYLDEALGDDDMELDGEFLVREHEVTAF